MQTVKKNKIVEEFRHFLSKNRNLNDLTKDSKLYNDIKQSFGSVKNIIHVLLEEERNGFKEIFQEYNFEGMNAIDILLIVSQEISNRFYKINPFTTARLQDEFPNIYNAHLNERMNFVYEKIQINLTKGNTQGIYRSDISIEMIARMYITKLKDLHKTEMFNPDTSNFVTLFNTLIHDFIIGISNDEGKKYYKQRKQFYNILNFRNK